MPRNEPEASGGVVIPGEDRRGVRRRVHSVLPTDLRVRRRRCLARAAAGTYLRGQAPCPQVGQPLRVSAR